MYTVTPKSIDVSDDERIIDVDSEDDFEDVEELELASGVKRRCDLETSDVKMNEDVKKQKIADATVRCHV